MDSSPPPFPPQPQSSPGQPGGGLVTPDRLERWREELARLQREIMREPSSRRAWGQQIRVEMLLYLLARFSPPPRGPQAPNTPPADSPSGAEQGAGPPAAPSGPAPPPLAPPPPPPDASNPAMTEQPQGLARPSMPYVKGSDGRAPRTAESFRGKLGRLASVNRERHDAGEAEREMFKQRIAAERLHRVIYEPMRMYGLFIRAEEFNYLTRTRMPPDFTLKELYEHLMVKNESAVCGQCRYSLRGLPPQGYCPECGSPYQLNSLRIDALMDLLNRDLPQGRPPVMPDSWLMHHFGMWDGVGLA